MGDQIRTTACPRAGSLRLAVIIASRGRPTEVAELLERLGQQTRLAETIVLSVVDRTDLPPPDAPPRAAIVVMGNAGLPAQRNRGIDRVRDRSDIVVMFDDDYLPSRRALEGIERLFVQHPEVVGADGWVLADGVASGGLGSGAARQLVEAHDARPSEFGGIVREQPHLYGCNMAFRVAALGACRFDENLPLSAWQEDVDFAGQLQAHGRIVHTRAFAGVHRGVIQGRQSARKVGYAQIANPVYLLRKGTMRPAHAAWLMLKNLAANLVLSCYPERHVDRRGRAVGNLLGLIDVVRRKDHPRRILEL